MAQCLFDDDNAMTRIDMSEYGEKHTVSRLIGVSVRLYLLLEQLLEQCLLTSIVGFDSRHLLDM